MEDETDEKSKGLIKNLKAAASANHDLVFAFVGFKQWEEFAESFDVNKKTPLPKMIVWDGDEEYFTVSKKLLYIFFYLTLHDAYSHAHCVWSFELYLTATW